MPNKIGVITIVCGGQGTGKTPIIKSLIKKSGARRKYVFDPRHEYPDDFIRFFRFSEFSKIFPRITDSTIVVEEATGFLEAQKDMDIAEKLIAVEHHRNVIYFVFHSLIDIPPYILRYAKFLILLETGDDAEKIRRDRPKIYPYFIQKKRQVIRLK
jgi:septin family protein